MSHLQSYNFESQQMRCTRLISSVVKWSDVSHECRLVPIQGTNGVGMDGAGRYSSPAIAISNRRWNTKTSWQIVVGLDTQRQQKRVNTRNSNDLTGTIGLQSQSHCCP